MEAFFGNVHQAALNKTPHEFLNGGLDTIVSDVIFAVIVKLPFPGVGSRVTEGDTDYCT